MTAGRVPQRRGSLAGGLCLTQVLFQNIVHQGEEGSNDDDGKEEEGQYR